MASFTVIRPRDDAMTQQCADWADDFCANAQTHGHNLGIDLDGAYTSVDQPAVLAAVHQPADLVLYFGHGDTDCWPTVIQRTVESSNVSAISGKPVVSVACKTACILAGAAITAGATAWLGFTISVPVLAPHRNVDPIGESLVRELSA